MSGSTLKCPNCGAPRTIGSKTCASCGIIFEKYAAKQRMLEEMAYQQHEEKAQKRANLIKLSGLAGAVLAVVGVGFAVFSGDGSSQSESEEATAKVTTRTNPYNPYNPDASKKLLPDNIKKGMAAATFTITNRKLDYPRNKSTGVVVTASCRAITSSQITYYNDSGESFQRQRLDSAREMIDKYESQIEEKRAKFLETCTDCSPETFDKTVTRISKRLQEAYDDYDKAMDKVANTSTDKGNLTVKLNKSSYMARADESNDSAGLALLAIHDTGACEPPVIGDSSKLNVGDKVFIIGGNGRVADGVITGFSISSTGLKLIYHDTYVGNVSEGNGTAGIPLFNDKGELLGIHTRSSGANRTAIAIEDVLQEFRLPL